MKIKKRGKTLFTSSSFFTKSERGEILVENVLFIILNIIFISILILFLFKQSSGAGLLEQTYSKQIALMIDSAKPAMEIKLKMDNKIMIKNKKVKHALRKGIKEISHCAFFPKNRIGAEKIISVYWFVILIIIAGAVVAMVSLFYGSPYDVRVTEANIMINQVS